MSSTAQFENIYHGYTQAGKLRIAQSGLGWKSGDEKVAVVTVPQSDIKWIEWIRVARDFRLLITTPRTRLAFDGFLKDDFERLSNICKNYYNANVESKETSVRGWNWGVAEVQGQDLAFLVAGKPAFTTPLSGVVNTSITKTEVAIEFAPTPPIKSTPGLNASEEATERRKLMRAMPDEVCEMRFYVPGSARGMQKKAIKAKNGEGDKDQEEDEESDNEEDDGETAAQVFHDSIKEKADLGQLTSEAICTISDVLCLTPRGRFDIDMHPEFLRLRGKTYDYRITYPQIQKLFLLPRPDEVHCLFVVNIDPPIRQGQTRYPYLVMQFIKEDILELELSLDEETIRDKYEGLKKKYDDPGFEVVSLLFRVLAQKKVTTPGSYQSHEGQSAIKCNVKANEGHLYLLEKQLLFISKQPTLVPFSDVSLVTIARVGGALPSARTFDLNVRTKSSPDHPIIFSSINKEELTIMEEFFTNKKIRIKNELEEVPVDVALAALGSDDDDAMIVDNVPGEEEDEDSEVDEDFKADSESDGGSASDDSEEDGGDASENGNVEMSNEEGSRPRKKAKTT